MENKQLFDNNKKSLNETAAANRNSERQSIAQHAYTLTPPHKRFQLLHQEYEAIWKEPKYASTSIKEADGMVAASFLYNIYQ